MSFSLTSDLEFHCGVWTLRFQVFQFLGVQVDRKRGCLCKGMRKDGNPLWGIGWRRACGVGLRLGISVRVEVVGGVRDGDRG